MLTLVIAVAVWMSATAAAADPALSQQDRRGPVTVAVTLLPDEAGGAMRVKVVLDTHSVDLDRIELREAVVLRRDDGRDVAATGIEEAQGGGHHRQATLVFPPLADGPVLVVVKNVGNIPERVFRWDAVKR
jgi:hypothetical protein